MAQVRTGFCPFPPGEPSIWLRSPETTIPSKGATNPSPRELFLGKSELRFGLSNLGIENNEIGAIVLGKRFTLFLHKLVALSPPFQPVQNRGLGPRARPRDRRSSPYRRHERERIE